MTDTRVPSKDVAQAVEAAPRACPTPAPAGCAGFARAMANGKALTVFEVGVEDGDINHYTIQCAPAGYTVSIVELPRSHDVCSTPHGEETGKESNCPYVLRFEWTTALTSNFEVGYSYDQPTDGFHDVNWKVSDGQQYSRQASWSFVVGTGNGPVHSPVPEPEKPNILLIVLDDMGTDRLEGWDPPHTEHEYAVTPNLDQLASDGIKFTNFYTNPICSPTRSALQTGRHPFLTGMGGNSEAYALPNSEVLLAELLKDGFDSGEGYSCGAFGKWHIGQYDPTHAVSNGYDRFYGSLGNSDLLDVHHFYWLKIEHDAGSSATSVAATAWYADVVRADAVDWINAQTTPFFAYVAFNPPHRPWQVPPGATQDARDLLSTATDQALSGFDPGDPPTTEAESDLFYRAAIEAVDAEIGYLLADISDVLDNTMVFVLCDNGPHSDAIGEPHPEDHGKGTVYQLGVRMPLIVKGPLVSAGGQTCERPVGAVDLWQTIADISGAKVCQAVPAGTTLHSTSFLPLIQDPSGPATSPWAFSQSFQPTGVYSHVTNLTLHKRSITDGQYKYIRTIEGHTAGQPVDYDDYTNELYDLVNDPDEQVNLLPGMVNDPNFIDLRDALENLSEY